MSNPPNLFLPFFHDLFSHPSAPQPYLKTAAGKNVLGTAGKGTTISYKVNLGTALHFTQQGSNKPTIHSSSVQSYIIPNSPPLFPRRNALRLLTQKANL